MHPESIPPNEAAAALIGSVWRLVRFGYRSDDAIRHVAREHRLTPRQVRFIIETYGEVY
jgi:hypothetical protein